MPSSSHKNSPEKDPQLVQKLIQSIHNLLAVGDWDSSLFLKANKKRLEEIQSQAESLLSQMTAEKESVATSVKEAPPGYKKVYISLFQTDANNLTKWQAAIKALEKYSVSRPVYYQEEHVQALIRSKADPKREAYVVAFVQETDIVQPYLGRKIEDRFGHELVTLREQAIKIANIVEFVHNKNHYHYSQEEGLVLFH